MNNQTAHLLEQHFDTAFSAPNGIKKLRELILTLAMQGKLVAQDPGDAPASELLEEIRLTRSREDAKGKSKKGKELPEIRAEEMPYVLQEGWEWVRLGEIGITQTGTTPPSNVPENFGQYIPFIGPGYIKNGIIDYTGDGLSEQGLAKGRLIDANSVLMVCIGGSIGKHAINDIGVTCNQQINTLTPYPPVLVRFVYWEMATILFQEAVIGQAGGSATPIINKQKWSSIPLPLPPLPEQHRIVAKIDQLMALCDTLEQRIADATAKQTELLNAVMAQV